MAGTGSLFRDDNSNVIPVANDCVFEDASTPAVVSPVAYTTQAVGVTTINIPVGTTNEAFEFRFRASTALRLSTTTATLATNYYVFDAGVNFIIPCRRSTAIYIAGDAAAGTIQFLFHLV